MVYFNNKPLFPDDVFRGDKFTVDRYPDDVFTVTDSMQSNNGNFRAVDDAGRLHWFNTVTDDIYMYRRTKEVTDNRTECKVSKQRASVHQVVINAPVRFHATWDELDAAEDRCLPNDTDL